MKKRTGYQYIIAATAVVCLLSGCSKEAEKNKERFRQTGIECMEQGDYAGALEAFETALKQEVGKIDADDIDISYYKAASQYAGGDLEGALATYSAIIDFLPKEAGAYYLRGCLYLERGEMEPAKADFSAAVQYRAKDYELYIHIYENLSGAGEEEDAKKYLDKAFEIKGNEVSDLEYRGRIYGLLGEYENALAELGAAKEKGSVKADLYLAQVYEALGNKAEAEICYKTYLEQDSSDSEAFYEAGMFWFQEGRYEEAVSYLEQGLSVETVTNKQELLRSLVIAYEYNGNFDRAWEVIQQYTEQYPNDAEAQREYVFLKNRQVKEESSMPETEELGSEATES